MKVAKAMGASTHYRDFGEGRKKKKIGGVRRWISN
jgi:hypothetical protein